LLIGAGFLFYQVRAFRAGNLGFDPRNVVVVPLRGVGMKEKLVPLKAAMSRLPNVQGTTFSSLVLGGKETPQIGVVVKGIKGYNLMATLMVDPDFTRVFHIEPVAGRAFAPDEGDAAKVFLWNRQALRLWHLETPAALGRVMNWNGLKQGKVVGILPNFHYKSLQFPVEPLLLLIRPIAFRYMYIRLAPQGTEAAMRELVGVWRGLIPDRPLEHYSLAEHYDQAYSGEERAARMVGLGGLVGLLIAGLALPGLWASSRPRRGEMEHG
jgi:putative ABC transport system permease protein